MPIPPERICCGRLSASDDMIAGVPSASSIAISAVAAYSASGARKCDISRKQGGPTTHNRP